MNITKTFYWAIWSETHEDEDGLLDLSEEQKQEYADRFAQQMNATRMYVFRMETKKIEPRKNARKKEVDAT